MPWYRSGYLQQEADVITKWAQCSELLLSQKKTVNKCWFTSMELNLKKNCSATEITFVAKQLFLSISDEFFFKFCGLNQL